MGYSIEQKVIMPKKPVFSVGNFIGQYCDVWGNDIFSESLDFMVSPFILLHYNRGRTRKHGPARGETVGYDAEEAVFLSYLCPGHGHGHSAGGEQRGAPCGDGLLPAAGHPRCGRAEPAGQGRAGQLG